MDFSLYFAGVKWMTICDVPWDKYNSAGYNCENSGS